jgi:hypothetical protein
VLLIAIALTLGSFPALQGLKLQQLSLLVVALISAAMALLVSGRLFAAGTTLAIASIKPQLVVPIAACLLLWALSDLRRRQRLVWGLGGGMVALLIGAEILLPGWFGNFLAAAHDYRNYAGGMSMLDVLLTPWWGRLLTVLIVVAVAAICWRSREEEAGSPMFTVVIALVLAVTVIIIPMFAPYNYILSLPSLLLMAQNWSLLWRRDAISRAGCLLAAAAIAWPWLTAIGLTVASLVLSPEAVQQAWWLPLYTSAKIPTPMVCLIPLSILLIATWQQRATTVLDTAPRTGMVA